MDVGHAGVSRKRCYIFCCHNSSGVCLYDIYDMYQKVVECLSQKVSTECQDYFQSSNFERTVHLESVARKRKIHCVDMEA